MGYNIKHGLNNDKEVCLLSIKEAVPAHGVFINHELNNDKVEAVHQHMAFVNPGGDTAPAHDSWLNVQMHA